MSPNFNLNKEISKPTKNCRNVQKVQDFENSTILTNLLFDWTKEAVLYLSSANVTAKGKKL